MILICSKGLLIANMSLLAFLPSRSLKLARRTERVHHPFYYPLAPAERVEQRVSGFCRSFWLALCWRRRRLGRQAASPARLC
jgi:hypothetical protein